MAFVAKFAASKFVGDKLENHFGPENPKFDFYKGEDGRRKKVKKPLPPGLSYHDERVLDKVRRKAWKYEWWVDAMCCCGIHLQFGTVTLWGLIPFVGDFVSLLKAVSLINAARRVEGGLPAPVLLAMLAWAAVDFAIKLVPIVGEVVTAIVKPNTRNLARVEALLAKRAAKRQPRGGSRGGSRGAGAAAAEVVVAEQPDVERGMTTAATSGPSGSRDAGSTRDYGTVQPPAARTKQQQRRGERRFGFLRRNAESDSEEEPITTTGTRR